MELLDVDAEIRRMRDLHPAERVVALGEIIERIERELQTTEPSEEEPAQPAQAEANAEE
jgi:hypothetical protein